MKYAQSLIASHAIQVEARPACYSKPDALRHVHSSSDQHHLHFKEYVNGICQRGWGQNDVRKLVSALDIQLRCKQVKYRDDILISSRCDQALYMRSACIGLWRLCKICCRDSLQKTQVQAVKRSPAEGKNWGGGGKKPM